MGTIAEKLAYLQETKEAIRQAIVDMGGEAPESDPFAVYPDLIYNIPPSTELPKGVYTLTTEANDPAMGTVTPGGYVSKGISVTIEATPNEGYVFNGWARYAGKATTPTSISEQKHTFEMSTNVRFVAIFQTA